MNEERPKLQFHEDLRSDLPDWAHHPLRAAEGRTLSDMIRGRVERKKVQRTPSSHAYLFLLSRQMTSMRYDRGLPTRPSKACDHDKSQEASGEKKMKGHQVIPSFNDRTRWG
jgi:hypothetical protein